MNRNNMLSRIGSARRAKLSAYGARDKDVEKAEKFQHGGRVKKAAGGRTEKQVNMAGSAPRARLDRAPRSFGGADNAPGGGLGGSNASTTGGAAESASASPAGLGIAPVSDVNISEMSDAVNNSDNIAEAHSMGLAGAGPEATTVGAVPSDLAAAMAEMGLGNAPANTAAAQNAAAVAEAAITASGQNNTAAEAVGDETETGTNPGPGFADPSTGKSDGLGGYSGLGGPGPGPGALGGYATSGALSAPDPGAIAAAEAEENSEGAQAGAIGGGQAAGMTNAPSPEGLGFGTVGPEATTVPSDVNSFGHGEDISHAMAVAEDTAEDALNGMAITDAEGFSDPSTGKSDIGNDAGYGFNGYSSEGFGFGGYGGVSSEGQDDAGDTGGGYSGTDPSGGTDTGGDGVGGDSGGGDSGGEWRGGRATRNKRRR